MGLFKKKNKEMKKIIIKLNNISEKKEFSKVDYRRAGDEIYHKLNLANKKKRKEMIF